MVINGEDEITFAITITITTTMISLLPLHKANMILNSFVISRVDCQQSAGYQFIAL